MFEVSLGDGYKVRGRHICPTVVVEMQGVELQQSFHVFDMGGTDMVLGVEWHRSLGEVKVNWDELTMKFMIENEEKRIRGDPSLVKTLVSLKSMSRSLRKGGEGYLVEFGQMTLEAVRRYPGKCRNYLMNFLLYRKIHKDYILEE